MSSESSSQKAGSSSCSLSACRVYSGHKLLVSFFEFAQQWYGWSSSIANALAILETQLMRALGCIDYNCGLHVIQVIGAQIGDANFANISGDFDTHQSLSRDIDRTLQQSQWGTVYC